VTEAPYVYIGTGTSVPVSLVNSKDDPVFDTLSILHFDAATCPHFCPGTKAHDR